MNKIENGKNIAAVVAGTPSGIPCHTAGKSCGNCPKAGAKPCGGKRAQENVLTVRLDPAAAQFVATHYQAILARNRFLPERDAQEMMSLAAAPLRRALPHDVITRLEQFGRGQGVPVLVVEGAPGQPVIPPTPIRGFSDDSQTALADMSLLGLYGVMNVQPVAYTYENMGRLFRNVVPNPDARGQKSSHGFNADFKWHTDNTCGVFEHAALQPMPAALSPTPRFLGFAGLRNCDGAGRPVPTQVLPFAPVLGALRRETLAALCQPQFQVNAPTSNNTAPLAGVPLVVPCQGECFVRFEWDASQVFGLTVAAQAALDEFKAALDQAGEHLIEVNVEPGRLLVFDNYRVAHQRSAFDPGANWSEARWLRRCYACQSLKNGILADAARWPNLWK